MNCILYIKKAFAMCLVLTTIMSYSMVALANSEKLTGELIFNETDGNIVTVNGETAKKGHQVLSSSTIETTANTSAVIEIATLGSIKLAPETTLDISFNENGISGKLVAGKVTVLNAADSVNIVTSDRKLVKLSAGESAVSNKIQDDDDDDDDTNFVPFLILGGAAALIIAAIVIGGDENNIDTNPPISPIR